MVDEGPVPDGEARHGQLDQELDPCVQAHHVVDDAEDHEDPAADPDGEQLL